MKLHIVPARTGLLWVRLGVATFMRQPLALTGMFFLFMATMSLISLIPVLGSALMLALLPAATLGFMVATEESTKGRFSSPLILAKAFRAGRDQLRSIALLGALYATLFLGVMGLSTLFDGGLFARFYLLGEAVTREQISQAPFQRAFLSAMALNLPLSLLFWHAPALVHWHRVPPIKALFFSIVTCSRNFGAYFVFGMAWLGFFLSALLTTVMVVSLLGGGPDLVSSMLLPLASLFAALFLTSLYFTFRDGFIVPDDGRLTPAPPASPT